MAQRKAPQMIQACESGDIEGVHWYKPLKTKSNVISLLFSTFNNKI